MQPTKIPPEMQPTKIPHEMQPTNIPHMRIATLASLTGSLNPNPETHNPQPAPLQDTYYPCHSTLDQYTAQKRAWCESLLVMAWSSSAINRSLSPPATPRYAEQLIESACGRRAYQMSRTRHCLHGSLPDSLSLSVSASASASVSVCLRVCVHVRVRVRACGHHPSGAGARCVEG